MTLFGGRIPNEDGDGYNVSPQPYNELLMIPGYGAQPVPPEKYVAANDAFTGAKRYGETGGLVVDESGASAGFAVGGYIGLARREGDFMQTYRGGKYWPCDPRAEEVFIEDIAHSLSLQCRYAGHAISFYSVAEHSVHIARWLQRKYGPAMALHGLLHDATEAYVVDVPRPLKPFLANYKDIESRNWLAIAARFGLARELPAEVHEADNRIIGDELVNMAPMAWHARYNELLGVRIGCWSPAAAETEFLITFEALTNRRVAA
ncbi:hypothetical protein [Rhizobium leucaenae]|uniref:hypothetical protein n=1 Tax=Rhizobium leucaenae TaxID=29450 RepID=UPI00161F1158|nr:hypothetical protein [Rhizobium leucaenae]MBB6299881.1 hypothetical protein [Rhizobium leucaenae]